MSETGRVKIKGREYKTVALRVSEFREQCPAKDGWAIVTHLVERTEEYVIVSAEIIKHEMGILATGLAEETRSSSQINKTSALENCETSAIGRALAAFGLGGSEYASANEVADAIHQQQAPKPQLSAADAKKIENLKVGIAEATSLEDLKAIGLGIKEHSATIQNAIRNTYGDRVHELKEKEKANAKS